MAKESFASTVADSFNDEAPEDSVHAQRIAAAQALGDELLPKRKEAIDGKKATNIEQDWQEDEEFYQSIDAANPEGETNVGKPVSTEGGPIGVQKTAPRRSSVFLPLTRPYVDAAAARIADMLLPNDDMPWSLKPTPIPETGSSPDMQPPGKPTAVAAAATGGDPAASMMGTPPLAADMMNAGPAAPSTPAMGSTTGMAGPLSMGAPTAMAQPPMNPAQAIMAQPAAVATAAPDEDGVEKTPEDKAADAATKQITDWLIECQYHAEFRKMLENAAKLGTGILKGPIPFKRVSQKMVRNKDGTQTLTRVEMTVPISVSIDPRNFFPDPACGEDVQRGGYTWEYDTLSARVVQELLKDDSYIHEQLKKVLREGPAKQGEAPRSPQADGAQRSLIGSSFGVWYFHGMVEREVLIAAGIEPDEFSPEMAEMMSVPAIITMINDTVVKAALTPMDMGGFPYDVMPWQRRAGMLWGMGVARQMRTPQRIANAAMRALMDNAGFTSGPLWAVRKGWVKPIDGSWELTPRKGFEMTDKAPDTAKIGDAITFTNVQAAQAELERIVQLAMKQAEDATGLPMLMQGQQGAAPDTVGGMTILNNNGSTVLRRIARQADDCVTERHIRRYYYWLLENSNNEAAKGDFQIDARGSTALVDRELANQALVQLAPILEADPDIHKERFHTELLKAHRIDPKNLFMTAAEKKARDAKGAPVDPRVQVAQINDAGETTRHEKELIAKHVDATEDRKVDLKKIEAEYEAFLGKLALDQGVSKDKIKESLFKTTSTLNTQVALANAAREHQSNESGADRAQGDAHKAIDVATAAAEPPDKAKAGHAFEQ
jgi:hypothetical protein